MPAARSARRACLVSLPAFALLAAGVLVARDTAPAADPWYADRLAALRQRQAEAPGRPLVLFLGSSRAVSAIRPAQLAADHPDLLPFSFARVGGGPVGNLLTLRRLLADGVRPAAVLVEVMPAFLVEEDVRPLLERHTAAGWRAAGLPVSRRLLADHLGDRLGRFRTNARRLAAAPPGEPSDPFGGHLNPRTAVTPAERAELERVQVNHFRKRLSRVEVSPVAAVAIPETLRLCRQAGARVGLLLAPECEGFRRVYGPGVRDALIAWVRWAAVSAGVPLIDAGDWLPGGQMADAHHALLPGAEAFTRRLGAEVLPVLLADRPALCCPVEDTPTGSTP